jgi:oligopeptide/dipeptide ABC transporter ATP-binding protein
MSDILVVEGLTKSFRARTGPLASVGIGRRTHTDALRDVAISLARGRVLALVGESGSGKTTLARCLVRLVEPDAGRALFDGKDIFGLDPTALRTLRRRLQIVYQDPYSSLNPLMAVGEAASEPALVLGLVTGRVARQELAAGLFAAVGLGPELLDRRPRELSGGQRQRVAIARALAVSPEVLIADEAVSALDVSVQAQIVNLLAALTVERNLGVLFITHQLAIVAQLAQAVAVMYLGRIVESGPVAEIFRRPAHPYTALLLAAHPGLAPRRRVYAAPPMPGATQGCAFAPRCAQAQAICGQAAPALVPLGGGRSSACHFPDRVPPTQH